jgi:glycosyltransferase involved in cell wall biosynthesis
LHGLAVKERQNYRKPDKEFYLYPDLIAPKLKELSFEIFLLLLFLIAFVGQVYFYGQYFIRLATYRENNKEEETDVPISLIIAVKNEKENLIQHLPILVNQKHKEFEIILVDDHSTDGTEAWINAQNLAKVKCISLKESSGKKAAIAKGISLAKFDAILLTDADCKPASEKWMSLMGVKLQDENSLVLGYGSYAKRNGLLNALIRYETIQTAVQYLSFALSGNAYMGVGRNLAYRKKVFLKSQSGQKYADIRSGDDDLLVNEMAEKAKVEICIKSEAHTISAPKTRWRSYLIQKRRHLQAGSKYKQSDRIRLAFLGISTLFFWLSFFLLCLKASYIMIIFPIFAVKLMLQYFTFGRIMQKLQERNLLFWVPLLEFFYIVSMTVVGVSTWIWKVDRWK